MKRWHKSTLLAAMTGCLLLAGVTPVVFSHCEIPCGIYGDPMRLDMMAEHITTIEKSMNEIHRLSKEPGANANQLVRWVNNKEHHADEFTHNVTQYFLTQRIKPAPETDAKAYHDYVHKVTALHQMMITAMALLSHQSLRVQPTTLLRGRASHSRQRSSRSKFSVTTKDSIFMR